MLAQAQVRQFRRLLALQLHLRPHQVLAHQLALVYLLASRLRHRNQSAHLLAHLLVSLLALRPALRLVLLLALRPALRLVLLSVLRLVRRLVNNVESPQKGLFYYCNVMTGLV